MGHVNIANILTTSQVAQRLNLTQARVLQLIRAGYIPALKIGRNYLIPSEALEALPAVPTWPTGLGRPKGSKNKKKTGLNLNGPRGVEGELLCVICMSRGKMAPAIRQSKNNNVAGLNMCLVHAEEYDNLP
jgi:excisionase family DNA binding protein